jgi:hypothetical protein
MVTSMDRIDTTYTATIRQQYLDAAANGADDDLDPSERPNRADRSDLGALKDDDDVEINNGNRVRVLCPGRGLGYFYSWGYDALFGSWVLGQYEASSVTDRAPADPEETPMPIFPEPTP